MSKFIGTPVALRTFLIFLKDGELAPFTCETYATRVS